MNGPSAVSSPSPETGALPRRLPHQLILLISVSVGEGESCGKARCGKSHQPSSTSNLLPPATSLASASAATIRRAAPHARDQDGFLPPPRCGAPPPIRRWGEILVSYIGTSLLVVLAVWLVSGRCGKLSKTGRLLMCWWAFTGLTHILIEGPFVFAPHFFKKENPNFFDEVCKSSLPSPVMYTVAERLGSAFFRERVQQRRLQSVKLNLSCTQDIKDDMDLCCRLAKEELMVVLPGEMVTSSTILEHQINRIEKPTMESSRQLTHKSPSRSMMPPSSFTGSPQQLSVKYRNCIEICTKLDSPNDLGTIKRKKELNTLHSLYKFILY